MADDCYEWRRCSNTNGQSEYRSFYSGDNDQSFVVERQTVVNTTEAHISSTAGIDDFGDFLFNESHTTGFNVYERTSGFLAYSFA